MSTISIALICQDNEDLIQDCLESVKWADEIIVVDAFSKDRTAEIARRYTDKVYQQHVVKNLNRQWNKAFEYCTKEWIFILSSDQRITPQLKDELKETIASRDAKPGYFLPLENYFLGKWIEHCGWYPDYNILFFKRGKAVYTDKEGGLLQVEGECGYLKNRLIHYSHREIAHTWSKINMITSRDAEYFFDTKEPFKKRYVLTKALRNFKKTYWKKQGYKDGMHGLAFCLVFSFNKFLIYTKYWELLQKRNKHGYRCKR